MTRVSNERWTADRLDHERHEVHRRQLDAPPPDLDEAIGWARKNAQRTSVTEVLRSAKERRDTCVVPRAGVANWEAQRRLMATLDEAGAGFLPITVDSLTRDLRFAEAAAQLAASTPEHSALNGFPVVAHGVDATRRLVEQFDKPVIARANAVDLRVCADASLAGGCTAFVSGPMYATLEYSKRVSLEESIPNWQYVFRLMGEYEAQGVPMAEDSPGFAQSGTCSVPSLMHVGVVIDGLIMAAQGVKNLMLYSMLQGNIAQDVASCLAVEDLMREYLDRFGFSDVSTFVASSDWNGAFPVRRPDAYGLIAANVFAAAIAGAPLNYVKSIDEGRGVPTAESNADSIRISRFLIHLLRSQASSLLNEQIERERHLNVIQARSMLDAVLDTGDGDPALGAIEALKTGVLDIPFSPNVHVRGDVLPVRDGTGAVRFLDSGSLVLTAEARALEAESLRSRAAQASDLTYEDVIADLSFLELDDLPRTHGG